VYVYSRIPQGLASSSQKGSLWITAAANRQAAGTRNSINMNSIDLNTNSIDIVRTRNSISMNSARLSINTNRIDSSDEQNLAQYDAGAQILMAALSPPGGVNRANGRSSAAGTPDTRPWYPAPNRRTPGAHVMAPSHDEWDAMSMSSIQMSHNEDFPTPQ
jgi:hypothetical protein